MSRQEKIKIADFFQRNLDKVKWKTLCKNKSIPVEFFERNLYYVDWYWLCPNAVYKYTC